jgi:hypothetical protein
MQWKLAAVGGILCLAAGGGLFSEHVASVSAQNVTAGQQREQQHQQNLAGILPDTPQKVLRSIHTALAEHDTVRACSAFEQSLRTAVGRALGAASCESGMANLAIQVKDPNSYVEFNVNQQRDVVIEGDTGAWIDGCAVTFGGGLLGSPVSGDPGPKVGKLHMTRILQRGLVVDGFTPCPKPPASGPGAPSTDAGSVPLPTSPREPVDTLLTYLANGDTSGCALFSDAGKAAFAKVQGAGDCPAAVTAFHGKIADPSRYAKPIGGDVTADQKGGGRFDLDACALVWAGYTVDGELPPPGPQLGRLTIDHPPGNGNAYWITSFAHC